MSFLEDVRAAREILSFGSELVSLLLSIGRACREKGAAEGARVAAEYAASKGGHFAAGFAGYRVGGRYRIRSIPRKGWGHPSDLGRIATIKRFYLGTKDNLCLISIGEEEVSIPVKHLDHEEVPWRTV